MCWVVLQAIFITLQELSGLLFSPLKDCTRTSIYIPKSGHPLSWKILSKMKHSSIMNCLFLFSRVATILHFVFITSSFSFEHVFLQHCKLITDNFLVLIFWVGYFYQHIKSYLYSSRHCPSDSETHPEWVTSVVYFLTHVLMRLIHFLVRISYCFL